MPRRCRTHPARERRTRNPASWLWVACVIRGELLVDIAANVEAGALHGSVETILEHSGLHAALYIFADGPILPVDAVPEDDGISRIETRECDFTRVEEKVADHRGAARAR